MDDLTRMWIIEKLVQTVGLLTLTMGTVGLLMLIIAWIRLRILRHRVRRDHD